MIISWRRRRLIRRPTRVLNSSIGPPPSVKVERLIPAALKLVRFCAAPLPAFQRMVQTRPSVGARAGRALASVDTLVSSSFRPEFRVSISGPLSTVFCRYSSHSLLVYRMCTEGMYTKRKEGKHSPRRFWQMGHRTMDTPSLGGRTVPRHHAPKRTRRSRKRTLRAAGKTQRSVTPAEPTQRKRAIRVAARAQKPAKPTPRKWAIRVAAKTQRSIKMAEQTQPKPALQRAAQAQEPA